MRCISTALMLGVLAQAAPAAAQDGVAWGNEGDWEIAIDRTIGDGCYALASWTGGTVLRIGRNPDADNFYFLIGNEKWASLKDGESYELQIQFGNRAKWDVKATGLQFNPGELTYLHAQSSQMEFVQEFQAALNMKITYRAREIDNLKLTGSRKAWDAVERCQKEVNTQEDPFADAGGGNSERKSKKSEDPFAE